MSWLKAIEGMTWMDEPARHPTRAKRTQIEPRLRTVAGVKNTLEERIKQAVALSQLYRRSRVAQLMGVDQSTVSKWLGPKHIEKRPYSKRKG